MTRHLINGYSMFYQADGSGIPIICIHPPLLTKENFKYQRDMLSSRFKIITFDLRGHGDSGSSKEQLTYPLVVEDIVHLMHHLHLPKAYLCGYSTGGSIVLQALLSHPELFFGGILVSAMSEVSDWWLKTRISLAVAFSGWNQKKVLASAIASGNANNKLMKQILYSDAMKGNSASWHSYYRYSMKYNCTAQLPQIDHPILMLYGKKDGNFHPYARILQKKLPHSEIHYIANVQHQIPTKAPLSMNHHITNWINKLSLY